MMFNLLEQTLTIGLNNASEAAKSMIEAVTVDNAYAIKKASQELGLGIDKQIDERMNCLEAIEMQKMAEAEKMETQIQEVA